jgi:membrane associated rhomboid family serine protease
MKRDDFSFSPVIWAVPLGIVFLLWLVFWFEIRFGVSLNSYGIFPRKFSGLWGILWSPFIHGNSGHLLNNSLPLAVLLGFQFYFYPKRVLQTILIGIFLTGFITWLIGRPSYHIGASGLIYFLAAFIFFKGVFSKHYRQVAVSLLIVFLYGGMIWYILPIKQGISWEGHLSGLLSGLFLALISRSSSVPVFEYPWERSDYDESSDSFMNQFDEFGNYVGNPNLGDSDATEQSSIGEDNSNKETGNP